MGSLELISRLCEVNNMLSDIVKEQQQIIEQSKIVEQVDRERMGKEISEVENEMDLIEYNLRRTWQEGGG